VELCGLEDADEHENVASPRADALDGPARSYRWEDGVLTSSAIADVPEDVAARGRASPLIPVRPSRVGPSLCCAAMRHGSIVRARGAA